MTSHLTDDDKRWLASHLELVDVRPPVAGDGRSPVFGTRGERLAVAAMVTIIAVVSIVVNPLNVGIVRPRILAGSQCQGAQHTPGGADSWGGCWPGEHNTGVPAGTALTTYGGSCTITTNNTVIDAKTVNCDLEINATGVVITRSQINGQVHTETGSFTLEDSEVINPARVACDCVGTHNFTMRRVEVVGGNRGVYCQFSCTIEDSWIHDSDLLVGQHASALRQEQYTTVRHNTLACEWTGSTEGDTGCSADLTGYPDFAPIMHNTITKNLFLDHPQIGYCAYGGGTGGKPFSGHADNATYIVFTDNVWEKGPNGKCGEFGPITDFIVGNTGNEWTNNRFDDGAVVDPA